MKNVFEKVVLPVFGVFGTLLTLLTFIFPNYAHIKIDLYMYLITIFFGVIITSTVIMLLINAKRDIKTIYRYNYFSIIPIQYVNSESIFIIRKEIELPLNLCLSIFIREELFERVIGLGYVSHIQDEFIQIKLFAIIDGLQLNEYLNTEKNIKNIIIRPSSNIKDIVASIRGESV